MAVNIPNSNTQVTLTTLLNNSDSDISLLLVEDSPLTEGVRSLIKEHELQGVYVSPLSDSILFTKGDYSFELPNGDVLLDSTSSLLTVLTDVSALTITVKNPEGVEMEISLEGGEFKGIAFLVEGVANASIRKAEQLSTALDEVQSKFDRYTALYNRVSESGTQRLVK